MEMILKNNLAQRMESEKMTERDLKEMTGLSVQKIKGVLAGEDLKISDAQKIAAVFDCSTSDIWSQVYSIKTEQVVTERQVVSLESNESVFN